LRARARAPRAGVYNGQTMQPCQIVSIRSNGAFRWKWRHVASNGAITESSTTYSLYYECVSAARQHGYLFQTKCR
jgi:hypothetical protein